ADLDPVAIDAGADFDHLTHELVAHDVAGLHGRHVAVEQVQVGAADRGRGDAHDRVTAVENLRIRNLADVHVVDAAPGGGLHTEAPFADASSARSSLSSSSVSGCAGRCGNSLRARLPQGAPSDRTISPVSTTCLNRRKSSSSCWCG